jgi:hypothetical protein
MSRIRGVNIGLASSLRDSVGSRSAQIFLREGKMMVVLDTASLWRFVLQRS